MLDAIRRRTEARMTGEQKNAAALVEITQTVIDRLCIRLGVSEKTFPAEFHGIAAEAAVKGYRRLYYEGIQSESENGIVSTAFVDDILAEYEPEFTRWRNTHTDAGSGRVVRFL